jgi:AcrR family transcriptional regulator
MGTKERRERERLETRRKILDAARELFVEQGYDAVTMRKIAEKIEYSPTAIYVHFKDKDELMSRLCDNDFGELGKQFQSIAKIADPIERLRRVGRAYAAFGLKNPNHYRFMFMTQHPLADPSTSELALGDPGQDAYAFLQVAVKDCVEQKLFREEFRDVELIAQTVWAGVHGVIALQVTMQDNPFIKLRNADRAVRTIIDVMIDGFTKGK